MDRDDAVQSLKRALRVIERLSRQPVVSLAQLHVSTGLPKSTLLRLLGTLIEEGYARKVSSSEGYALTSKVQRLSSAIRQRDLLAEAALPLMEAFTQEHLWPIALATLEADNMRVRASTLAISPYGSGRSGVNRRHGVLWSAMGWAYLAYCSADEREVIRKLARSSGAPGARAASNPARVNAKIERTRRDRYAAIRLAPRDIYRRIAIPILAEAASEEVLGALILYWYPSVMSTQQAASTYLNALYALATRIAVAVRGRTDLERPAPRLVVA